MARFSPPSFRFIDCGSIACFDVPSPLLSTCALLLQARHLALAAFRQRRPPIFGWCGSPPLAWLAPHDLMHLDQVFDRARTKELEDAALESALRTYVPSPLEIEEDEAAAAADGAGGSSNLLGSSRPSSSSGDKSNFLSRNSSGFSSLFRGSSRNRVGPETNTLEGAEADDEGLVQEEEGFHSGPPKILHGPFAKLVPNEASLARAARAAERRTMQAFRTGPGMIQLRQEAVSFSWISFVSLL